MHAKDFYKSKNEFLIKKLEEIGFHRILKCHQDYLQKKGCNPGKKRKVLMVFHDMIADTIRKKKLHPIFTELFSRDRKLNVTLVT